MTRLAARPRPEVASECAVFLGGTYAEYQLDRGEPVPTWAWLNVLAHGRMPQLERVTQEVVAFDCRAERWLAARRFLAGEVLDLVHDDGSRLVALQSAVLWPWELDVAVRPDAPLWLPSTLATLTLGALHGCVPVRP
jgi:hypothetical protein